MHCSRVIFSGHAVQRMFERHIDRDAVLDIVRDGETIAEYPDDQPFPSRLLLGFCAGRPIHVVVGFDRDSGDGYVITAYDPDGDLWDDQFRRRKVQ